MKTKNLTLKYGLILYFSYCGLFLIMKLFGLSEITELRFLNLLISFWISHKMAQQIRIDHEKLDYVNQLFSLLGANLLATALGSVSLIIYIVGLDPSFIHSFEKEVLWGHHLSVHQIFVAVFMEGMAGSMLVSFGVMQFWKNDKRIRRKVVLRKGVLIDLKDAS